MQRINLEALESKNMTAVSEDTLSEVNGGCNVKVLKSTYCGRTTYYVDSISSCAHKCKGGAAVAYAKRYNQTGTFKLRPGCSNTCWWVSKGGYTACMSEAGEDQWNDGWWVYESRRKEY